MKTYFLSKFIKSIRANYAESVYISFCYNIVNTLRPGQDGCHFPGDIFKCIFLNENVCILIAIPKGLINNIPALV